MLGYADYFGMARRGLSGPSPRHPAQSRPSSIPQRHILSSGTILDRIVRPGPDVPATQSLDQLVADARAAEKRIAELEQTKKRTAKTVLFENLDQALRIEAAVERGRSVAAFARQAGIEERRAQRLYKLAPLCDKIKKAVQDREDQYGDDFEYPSWKQFVRSAPADHDQKDNGIGLAKTLIADDLYQRLEAAQTRIAELEMAFKLANTAREEVVATPLFPRGDPERETPQWLFDHFDREFHLTLDVAATRKNTKCPKFYTKVVNGLVQIWFGNVWLNPPFSEIELWAKKGWEYAQTSKGVVVALLPIWPSAPWFQKYAIHGHIRLLTTRISFAGTVTLAPFNLMVVVWTATSQCKHGRLHVTMEDVSDPRKAARQARVAAKAMVQRKVALP
jgi:phage N-6-adenine-methyltransferase